MSESEFKPFFKMVEIYGGKDPDWKGWHNLILVTDGDGDNKAVAGPVNPETSIEMAAALGGICDEHF